MGKIKQLVKSTSVIAFGRICTQAISFFLLPLYTTKLNTAEYGTIDIVNTISSLLLPIVSLQIQQGLFRELLEVREDTEKKRKTISTCIIGLLVLFLVFSIVSYIVYIITNNEYVLWTLFCTVAIAISNVMLQLARGVGKIIIYALGSLLSAITTIGLNIFLLVEINFGPKGMLLSTIIGNIVCAIFIYLSCKVYMYFGVQYFDKKICINILKYSVPLIPNSLAWWLVNASDRAIIAIVLGVNINGILAIARKFPDVLTQMYDVFNIGWMEVATLHNNDADNEKFFSDIINFMVGTFSVACSGMLVVVSLVYPYFVTNEEYRMSYNYIFLYVYAALFSILINLYSVVYIADKRTIELAKTTILAGVINAISNLVLVFVVGGYAAPLSSIIAYSTIFICRYKDINKTKKIPLQKKVIFFSIFIIGISTLLYLQKKYIISMIWLVLLVGMYIAINRDKITQLLLLIKEKKTK